MAICKKTCHTTSMLPEMDTMYHNSTTLLLHQSSVRHRRTTIDLHSAHHLNLKDSVFWMHLCQILSTATVSPWLSEAGQWLHRCPLGSVLSLHHHHYLARLSEIPPFRIFTTLHSAAAETWIVFLLALHLHLAQTNLSRSRRDHCIPKATARAALCSRLVSAQVFLPSRSSTRTKKTMERPIQIARRTFFRHPSMT